MSFLLHEHGVRALAARRRVRAAHAWRCIDTEPIVEHARAPPPTRPKPARGRRPSNSATSASPTRTRVEAMLEGVNFTAEQGQTVAFIGSTGSGKSSLINLVPRFYDATPRRGARRRRRRARLQAEGVARQDRLRAAAVVPVQGNDRQQRRVRRYGPRRRHRAPACDVAQATEFIDKKQRSMIPAFRRAVLTFRAGRSSVCRSHAPSTVIRKS